MPKVKYRREGRKGRDKASAIFMIVASAQANSEGLAASYFKSRTTLSLVLALERMYRD
jgi:ERCC4-related helicase